MIRSTVLSLTLALVVATGCSKPAAQNPEASGAALKPEAAHETAQALPAAGTPAEAQPGAQTVTGPVLETMDAAGYTYVRVKTATGDIWAATSPFKVAVGDRVVVPLEMPMEHFSSKALKRDFPRIYFTSRITHEGEAPAAAMPAAMPPAMPPTMPPAGMPGATSGELPPGHAPVGSGMSNRVPDVTEVIPQPAGATTVANLWANRKALSGKTVTVRGKVVKFNGGILDRNWMHIQDGTGAAEAGTNDITVTSAAAARPGDIVTVTGMLVVDKDFGAGYAYPVMIEGATIVLK
jgi:hypothetical protein